MDPRFLLKKQTLLTSSGEVVLNLMTEIYEDGQQQLLQ